MWYKRYGYKQPLTSSSGIGCFSFFAIAFGALILSALPAAYFDNGWLLSLFIPLSIALIHYVDKYALAKGNRIRANRRKYHICAALRNIESGNKLESLESIRKAKIYGVLPKELLAYENIHRID